MAEKKGGVTTSLIGHICTPNTKMLHLWPWCTKLGAEHAMHISLGIATVLPGDVSVERAEVVAVYTAREMDGSSGIKLTIMALDGTSKGRLADVYTGWIQMETR